MLLWLPLLQVLYLLRQLQSMLPILDSARKWAPWGHLFMCLVFATGPTVWAPFSELTGRRIPIMVGQFGLGIFSIACGAAKDNQTLMLGRYFSGFFAASAITLTPATGVDLYNARQRTIPITCVVMVIFLGPLLAQPIGGYITASHLGWRWTMYLSAIMAFFGLCMSVVFLEETYPPCLLVKKARLLRQRTGNWAIHAKQEQIEFDPRYILKNYFSKPLRVLFTEPIVFLMSLYMAFAYGLLYALLGAYQIVFIEVYHMKPGNAGLPFLGLIVGLVLSGAFIILNQPSYRRKLAANNGISIPEWRLPPVMVGAVAFAIGLFW